MVRFSSLFISHGAPTLATSQHVANTFLRELGQTLPKPRAVIVVSPHWAASGFSVKSVQRHSAWHDFSGFPAELQELRYAPAGDEALAEWVTAAIAGAGLPTAVDINPRIDHGVWVPMMLMWPQADVPLVQISTGPGGPAAHWRLGEALRPFTDEGALIVGSGSLVHNLHELSEENAPAPDWVRAFDTWMSAQLAAKNQTLLLDYRRKAPSAKRAHPSEEHLLPLFAAAAAGGATTKLHESFAHGGLSMSAYGFH